MKNESNEADIFSIEITIGELAEILNINLSTARRLCQMDVFKSTSASGRSGQKYYNLVQSVQAFLLKKQSDHDEELRKTDIEKLKMQKLKAEISLKKSQSELHQLKTDIEKGKYLRTDDVKHDYEEFFVIFKKFALALPARVGGCISGYIDPVVERAIEKDIHQEICSMLRTFVVALTPREK